MGFFKRKHGSEKRGFITKRRVVWTLVLGVLVGLGFVAYFSLRMFFPYLGWKEAANKTLGFTMKYPADWHYYEKEGYLSPFSRSTFKDHFPVSLNFWVIGSGHYAGEEAFDAVVWQELSTIEKVNPGVQAEVVHSSGDTPMTKAVITRFMNRALPPKHEYDNIGAIKGEEVIYWVSRGDETIRFDYLYPIAEKEYYTELFEKMLRSLQIDLPYESSSMYPFSAFSPKEEAPQDYFFLMAPPGFLVPDYESIPLEFVTVSEVITNDKMEYQYVNSETGGLLTITEDRNANYLDKIMQYGQLRSSAAEDSQVLKRDVTVKGSAGTMVVWYNMTDEGKKFITGISIFLDRDEHLFDMEIDASGMMITDPYPYIRMLETFKVSGE